MCVCSGGWAFLGHWITVQHKCLLMQEEEELCVCVGLYIPPSPAQSRSSNGGKGVTQSRGVPQENSCSLLSTLKVLNTTGCVCCEAEQVDSYAEFPGPVPKGGSLYLRFTTAVKSAYVSCQPYHLNGQGIYIKLQLFFECLLLFIWRQMRGDSSQMM